MQFCPACENMMFVKKRGKSIEKKVLICQSCGHEEPFDRDAHGKNYVIETKKKHGSKDKTIVVKEIVNVLITDEYREANEWRFEGDEQDY